MRKSIMAAAAELIRAALEELIRQAAQGSVMHNDDSGMRILRLTREPGDKRTGTFTSGIVSMVGAWTIALLFTGWKHAGENLAEVLKHRARELPAAIQMSDALSRNSPKACGREPRRGAEAASTRTAGADPDERRVITQLAEGRRRTLAGKLPRTWKAAGGGGGGSFSGRMPLCCGDAAASFSS